MTAPLTTDSLLEWDLEHFVDDSGFCLDCKKDWMHCMCCRRHGPLNDKGECEQCEQDLDRELW